MGALGTATVSAFPNDCGREINCKGCLKTSGGFFFSSEFSEDVPKPNNL